MKCPLVVPFWADLIFMPKVYKPCLQHAAYEIPLYLDYCYLSNLVEISSVVLQKKSFKGKVYGQTDGQWMGSHH